MVEATLLKADEQQRITDAIKLAESRTSGEIAVIIAPYSDPLFFWQRAETRVRRAAQRAFFKYGLDKTKERTAILIYISHKERRAELLADQGVDAQVLPGSWQSIITDLTLNIAHGRLGFGLVHAIEHCAEILNRYFPGDATDDNVLSDDVLHTHQTGQ